MTTTYEQAVADVAQIFAQARARRDALSPERAAAEAYVPGGPSVDELTALIRDQRAAARRNAAA